MADSLINVLTNNFDMTPERAKEEINEARELMHDHLSVGDMESAHDVCSEMWGLEADYLMDLM